MNHSSLVSRTSAPGMSFTLLKKFLRQDHVDDDTLLALLFEAATLEAEQYTQLALTPQVRVLRLTGTPPTAIQLDFGPVRAVDSIMYTPADDGADVLIDDADYVLSGDDKVYPVGVWPNVSTTRDGLFVITYSAGPPATSPPTVLEADVQLALALLCEAAYTREADDGRMRATARLLLDPHRKGQGV